MAKRSRNVSVVDAEINTPNANVTCFHKTCWLWVFLLTILLSSSGAYSATDTQRSEEGTCHYDLTSIAVLSCMQPDSVLKPSSQTCCNALLYAIDQVPGSDESGACCLCRYMKERWGPPELATTYILCNGKDRHIISKWSTFHMEECLAECTKTSISFVDMGTSADSEVVHVHDTGKGIWIAFAVFSVMALASGISGGRQQLMQVSSAEHHRTKVSLELGAGDVLSLHRHHRKRSRREGFHHLEHMMLDVSLELTGMFG